MRHFKIVRDGYILTVGTGVGGEEISENEYRTLFDIFMERPSSENDIYELRFIPGPRCVGAFPPRSSSPVLC